MKPFASYTREESAEVQSRSPAAARYLEILSRIDPDDIHAIRHNAWLDCAAATLLQVSPPREVCEHWSRAADSILTRVWREHRKEFGQTAIFALGKLGANELNLSSDIDLMIVTEEMPTQEQFKAARQFVARLSESGPSGFCFRVDLDLRPGGQFSPLLCSAKQLQDYYWSLGETWERLALVRFRAVCGEKATIQQVEDIVRRYCYRKHLDYGLLEDLKKLRSQIHHHHFNAKAVNLKLVPGGIRDIELFVHALQIIHGGKIPELRTQSTDEAFNRLQANGLFDVDELDLLWTQYWKLRGLENSVQAVNDEHTHVLPGERVTPEIREEFARVDKIVKKILGLPSRREDLPEGLDEQKGFLESLGYDRVTVNETWPKLISLTALSTRTFEDEAVRKKFLRYFCEQAAKHAVDQNLALSLLVDFMRNTRAKTSFFYLLHHSPNLVTDLCVLFGCSPHLGGMLSARPELLDSYLLRSTAESKADTEGFLEGLVERRLMSELVAASAFLKNFDVDKLCEVLTQTADQICKELVTRIGDEMQSKNLNILALGKWGSRELGIQSDLDFIFLLGGAASEHDHKAARRVLTRLSEPHRGGSIYKIDLRLRPSGKAGPLMLEMAALYDYLTTQASPWERQTYLRARGIGGDENDGAHIRAACVKNGLTKNELVELANVQKEIWKPVNSQGVNIKTGPGGILDIELAAQTAVLMEKIVPASSSTAAIFDGLSPLNESWKPLSESLRQLRTFEQALHLVQEHGGSSLMLETVPLARLAKLMKTDSADLFRRVKHLMDGCQRMLKVVDPRRQYF